MFFIVYQIKDTIFWKQITTIGGLSRVVKNCLSDQRYNFLKANHNEKTIRVALGHIVYQIKDTIFWKQITTRLLQGDWAGALFIRSKIQFFESKSQQIRERRNYGNIVYQIKDTIFWKQITTANAEIAEAKSCLSDQRYNFLKANHNEQFRFRASHFVVYQIKDTIFWKQITTNSMHTFFSERCLSD